MEDLLIDISKKEFDKQKYVNMVISDEKLRDFIVENMINHPKIMVYYHCFYLVSDASLKQPKLFYNYWDEIYNLLEHENSYHRDFGLIILANLASVDNENKFEGIINEYLELLHDEKIMTAETCVKNCFIVASVKTELCDMIVNRLLELEGKNYYPEKQMALMMSFVIEGFELIIEIYSEKTKLIKFANRHLTSISPKTRNFASQFVKNYC